MANQHRRDRAGRRRSRQGFDVVGETVSLEVPVTAEATMPREVERSTWPPALREGLLEAALPDARIAVRTVDKQEGWADCQIRRTRRGAAARR